MTVFARDLHSQATFSTHVNGSADFEIEVPGPAEYVVFAWTDPGIYTEESLGGMYSCMGMFVGQMNYLGKARVHLSCDDQEDHIPLAVAVEREQTVDGVYVCDFYAQDYVPRPQRDARVRRYPSHSGRRTTRWRRPGPRRKKWELRLPLRVPYTGARWA